MTDISARETAAPVSLVFIHDAAIDDFVATLVLEAMPGFDLKGVVIAGADCIPQPGMEVPANTTAVIRLKFKQWTGKSVFHCHILPHEDTGMMQNILLLPAAMTGHGAMGRGATSAPRSRHHGSA
jgi:hypothetical protein